MRAPAKEPQRNGPPTVGEWLRRRDDGKWAMVSHVARLNVYNPPTPLPMYEGDVIMEYSPGRTNVCSGGTFFWSKWERLEPEDMAQIAMKDAHGHLL
jgi:hypothetical protein